MIEPEKYDLCRDSLASIDGVILASCDNERKITAISKIIQKYKQDMGWT